MTCMEEIQAENARLRANNKNLINRNAILRQRPDLPVDRIPAIKEMDRLREKVKQLEADVAHHNEGWNACVVENNGLREEVERLDKLENLAASLGCAWFYGDFSPETKNESEMLEMMTDLGYVYKDEDELIDTMFRVRKVTPPQTTEGE